MLWPPLVTGKHGGATIAFIWLPRRACQQMGDEPFSAQVAGLLLEPGTLFPTRSNRCQTAMA
jgi:hypothetical protein